MANKFSDFLAQLNQPQNQSQMPVDPTQDPTQSMMTAEQSNILSQMGAQQRTPASPPPEQAPPPQAMGQMPDPTGGMRSSAMGQLSDKFNNYNSQYQDSLGKLKGYQDQYSKMNQGTDYSALAGFLGGLPQNKNPGLLSAAQSMAPESKAKQLENQIAQQQLYTKDVGDMAKGADYVKLLNGAQNQQNALMRQQMMMQRMGLQQQRFDFQTEKEARGSVNNDAMLKQYGPRLEGAAKIGELIDSAKNGKVISNQALLGQVNAEIARLETGSQSPGLGASEKTELQDKVAQYAAMRDSITGNPQDAVRPEVLEANNKMVKELAGSYMKGVDSRINFLRSGMRENQQGIVDDKHNSLINDYAPRFGGAWSGLEPIQIHDGKRYKQQGNQWVQVP